MIAMAVCIIGLTGTFAAVGQAIRIVRSGKEIASASQMLQQRLETFRYTPPWTNITTSSGITTLVSSATASATNFANATEVFSVEPYPAGGTPLVITRSPAGVLSTSGSDLSAQPCVKFTITVSWKGIGNIQRTRQLSTIMTKGGL
jgi:hypothetical protein